MARAEEFHTLREGLFFWQAYDASVKVDLSCCARRTKKGLVFIDPIALAEEALNELTAGCPPAAIVLTNGNHERAARSLRQRFQIPAYAHRDALAGLGDCIDRTLDDGEALLDELTVVELPGASPGEIGLHGAEVLHVGDALIRLPPLGLAILPDKYCSDPKELRRSLGKLLRFPFDALTFAHGLPVMTQARQRLSHLIA
jgi:glyoxylase-like metal-dependent hydrolase (beta-lactamase superfamily II)